MGLVNCMTTHHRYGIQTVNRALPMQVTIKKNIRSRYTTNHSELMFLNAKILVKMLIFCYDVSNCYRIE